MHFICYIIRYVNNNVITNQFTVVMDTDFICPDVENNSYRPPAAQYYIWWDEMVMDIFYY